MTEILTKIYNELWGTDTSLLIWTFFGFLLIVLISRKITLSKIWSNKNEISKINDYLHVFFNLFLVF